MPIDYKKYPDNWKLLRHKILERAGDRCELCFAPNLIEIYRHKDLGEWKYPYSISYIENYKPVKIVLTIHHIDGDIKNNHESNLIALCQRCHLRLDRPLKRNKKFKGGVE